MVKKTIYIKLLNEGSEAWRPTLGEEMRDNIFRVLPTSDYDPEDEEWEFIPGSIVRCKLQQKSDRGKPNYVFVAVEKFNDIQH